MISSTTLVSITMATKTSISTKAGFPTLLPNRHRATLILAATSKDSPTREGVIIAAIRLILEDVFEIEVSVVAVLTHKLGDVPIDACEGLPSELISRVFGHRRPLDLKVHHLNLFPVQCHIHHAMVDYLAHGASILLENFHCLVF